MVEKNNNIEKKVPDDWLTTKETALVLGVSPITLRRFQSTHKEQFEGLTMRSLSEREGKLREHLFWSPKARRILALGIKNKPIEDWKKEVTNEVIETGIVITSNANPLDLAKVVCQQIIAVIDSQKQMEKRVENLELKDRYIYVSPRTKSRCRKEVERVVKQYGLKWQSVWIPMRDKYYFNSYDDMTEEVAQKIINELNEKYHSKNSQKKLI